MRKTVAVFFGGRSPEHDVSVITGLQALQAIDQERFAAFPVYISPDGRWYTGDALRKRETFVPSQSVRKNLLQVTLDVRSDVDGRGHLLPDRGTFSFAKPLTFDVALLAFHGLSGENGCVQGLMEIANVPYTGMRPVGASVSMDKAATKRMLSGTTINLLPFDLVTKTTTGSVPSLIELQKQLDHVRFPVIVKPTHLGSSIGIAKADNLGELRVALPGIFRLDTGAIIEPFVKNMVEYNVAVRRSDGTIVASAIERPKSSEELLTFKAKYLSSGGKAPTKALGSTSEGMLSLTRDIDPQLDPILRSTIIDWAIQCFECLDGAGAPRIDFISDGESGKVWLNEVNPCPGSFSYFLWETAEQPILFTGLLSSFIDEALRYHEAAQLPHDPTAEGARLFARPQL